MPDIRNSFRSLGTARLVTIGGAGCDDQAATRGLGEAVAYILSVDM